MQYAKANYSTPKIKKKKNKDEDHVYMRTFIENIIQIALDAVPIICFDFLHRSRKTSYNACMHALIELIQVSRIITILHMHLPIR